MKLLSSYSIKHKLATIITFTTALALFIAIAAFLLHDIFTMRSNLNNDLNTEAKIISDNIATAILFNDYDAGNEILNSLKHDSTIVTVEVRLSNGERFVHYHKKEIEQKYIADIIRDKISLDLIKIKQPVIYHKKKIGEVIISASKDEIVNRFIYFVFVSILVMAFSLLIAIILSRRMQRLIYIPIQHLADTAKKVSEEKNYKIRASIFDRDELGALTEDFNDMLEHIQQRDEDLESIIKERTAEVENRNEALKKEIAERIKVQENLGDSETRFKSAFYNAATGMVLIKSDHCISQVNQAFCNMLGYTEGELVGTFFKTLTYKDDLSGSFEQYNKLINGEISHFQLEKRYIHKNGKIIWGLLNASSVCDLNNDFQYAIAQVQDVTEAHNLSDKLSYQASHDALTDLVNRREFERRLTRVLENVAEERSEHALLYIDLDQFKVVNDTCGHTAGDELLHQLSNIMEDKIRQRDTLARLGGDEFGVLMEHCNMDQAKRVANVIRAAVDSYRFFWEGKSFSVGASIGLTPINFTSSDIMEVMKQADAACYLAKESGRNRVHVYNEEDTSIAKRYGEMQWVTRINSALEENRFHLYAQPIMDIVDSDMTHYELLIRMEDNNGEMIPPGAFLPAAERYNLISKIDRWVLNSAFEWLTELPESEDIISFCSINLSGQNLGDEQFRTYVIDMLKEKELDTSKICLEITETAAIANLNNAMEFIVTLKDMGCLFALDDFGSGVSSFAYLKNLPVDYLKIDGMFVKDIVEDPIDFAMVKSINEIGHVMGKKTIAEFVENDAILSRLRSIGVDYAQGYGIGMPAPLELISSINMHDVISK